MSGLDPISHAGEVLFLTMVYGGALLLGIIISFVLAYTIGTGWFLLIPLAVTLTAAAWYDDYTK